MTSIQHRFFIDECLSPDLITHYLTPHVGVTGLAAEFVHYIDRFGPNSRWIDREFIPELSKDRRWVVVSGDSGKNSTRFESMRLICRQFGVTLVYAGSAVRHAGLAFYGPHFAAHWNSLIAAASGPKGGQYILRMHDSSNSHSIFEARECPVGYECVGGQCVPIQPLTVYDGAPKSLSNGKRRRSRRGA